MADPVELQCPICSGGVSQAGGRFACQACRHEFPQLLGIPDFRVKANTWISYADDWELARTLASRYATSSFEDLVRLVWSRRSNIPEEIVQRRLRGIDNAQRKYEWELDSSQWIGRSIQATTRNNCLEIGCGTGAFLTAASGAFQSMVGIDVSLAWLIAARKRLEQQNMQATLLCACVESLPFPARHFDVIAAFDVLEHVDDPARMLAEVSRASRAGALVLSTTPNRYSLSAEPHVGLWGVGFLPRSWMAGYVRWRNGMQYHHTNPLSLNDIRRIFRKEFECSVLVPAIWSEDVLQFRPAKRSIARLYNQVAGFGAAASVLLPVAPFFEIVARRKAAPATGRYTGA